MARIINFKTIPYLSSTKKLAEKLYQRTLHTTRRVMAGGMELKKVVGVLESFASSSLAEKWDNVGLLVEPSGTHQVRNIFLTNDLTEDVLDEAVKKNADLILSYHPPIFSSIKRITSISWKNRILIKAIENRIAIYSPHTSYDAIKGGVNDWLISCFNGSVSPIIPSAEDSENGVGRICKLDVSLKLEEVIEKVKGHLQLKHIRLACPHQHNGIISSIASCAGSGSSVLQDIDADLYLTGEMSHHDVLHAISNQRCVLLCEHSNTERGFLKSTLKPTLTKMMNNEVEIIVSEVDKDPLDII